MNDRILSIKLFLLLGNCLIECFEPTLFVASDGIVSYNVCLDLKHPLLHILLLATGF